MRIVITIISLYCASALVRESDLDYLSLLLTGEIILNVAALLRLILAFLFLLGTLISFVEPILASFIFFLTVIFVPLFIFSGLAELNTWGFSFVLTILSYFSPKRKLRTGAVEPNLAPNTQYLRLISGYKNFIDSQLNYFKIK